VEQFSAGQGDAHVDDAAGRCVAECVGEEVYEHVHEGVVIAEYVRSAVWELHPPGTIVVAADARDGLPGQLPHVETLHRLRWDLAGSCQQEKALNEAPHAVELADRQVNLGLNSSRFLARRIEYLEMTAGDRDGRP
jgi:hypothetical protein